MSPRWRLILAAAAFLGWMGWLGYTALTKSRGPMVSHVQAAAATHPVVATVEVGPDGRPVGKATVDEALSDNGPAAKTEIVVVNLPDAAGFDGPGQYLLLLTAEIPGRFAQGDGPPLPRFALVGQQRSPGNDLTGVGKPLIYRWTDDIGKQFESLRR